MDYQKFFAQLPELYKSWGQGVVTPKSSRFQEVLDQVKGFTTPNIMQLLNFGVECLAPNEVYCEIGCYQGASLIGALLENPERMAYAVDNFLEFNNLGNTSAQFFQNLSFFNLDEQIVFCEQDFEQFFFDLRELELEDKIGLYFYDAAHDYRSQLMGLLLVRPFLAEQAIIVSTHNRSQAVRQANYDFMAAHPQCHLFLDFTEQESANRWHELQVFTWDIQPTHHYEWSFFQEKRNFLVMKFLSSFETVQAQIESLHQEAIELHNQKQFEAAESKYHKILILENSHIDVWLNLGMLYYDTKKYQSAFETILKAIELNSNNAKSHYYLGLVLERIGDVSQAIQAYQTAISLDASFVDAYNDLGNLLAKTNHLEAAESVYRQAIAANSTHFGAYLNLGNLLFKQNRVDLAYQAYSDALKIKPNDPEILNNLVTLLSENGNPLEAIKIAAEASILLPNDFSFKLRQKLMLPILYETTEEIDWYRNRFLKGLQEIIHEVSLETPETIDNAVYSLGYSTNFYLAYQGYDDLNLQIQYGEFVHRIMAAKYPQWVQGLRMPPLSENSKIRIGYVSGYMHTHTIGRLMPGWIRKADRDKFEIYCYYIGVKFDSITKEFQDSSNVFHHIPEDIETVCQQIVNDNLHILVFTDIGMLAQITQMAGLRLAPVQCMSWGHPITSGSPTIDYFLSSDLMEPENGEEHYSEKLIRLPNISICYAQPQVPEISQNRADFNLRSDAVVYLSCQSLFKYLPQYDYIYPTIAQRLPQAQFAFISHPKSYITNIFRQRLQKAFAKAGLNSEEYCVIVPGLSWNNFLNLNLVSDVFLDTFSWSGGNTTLEAIACNLPIVTCPGEFMRGRHSYGILKMINVTETIAKDANEYIEIAVSLGLNREWRENIVERMKQCHSYLYNDQICVNALEAFYQRVVHHQLAINN